MSRIRPRSQIPRPVGAALRVRQLQPEPSSVTNVAPKSSKLPISSRLPTLSKGTTDMEQLRKHKIRRKEINKIIKDLQDHKITIRDFVRLIAPYTGDDAVNLHSVVAEDLGQFRKMVKTVCDTMTTNDGDVIAKGKILLMSTFIEKQGTYSDTMMKIIHDIFDKSLQ